MTEPNRLRDMATPNSYRTGTASEPAHATGALETDTPGAPAHARPTHARSTGRRWIGSRNAFISGLGLAILGTPVFFAPGLRAEEAGIGMVCLGMGIAVAVVGRGLVANAIGKARRSKLAAVGVLLTAPHVVIVAAAGLGLIAFGLMVLAMALGVI